MRKFGKAIWQLFTEPVTLMSCATVVATQHVGLSIRNYPSNKFKPNCEPIWQKETYSLSNCKATDK